LYIWLYISKYLAPIAVMAIILIHNSIIKSVLSDFNGFCFLIKTNIINNTDNEDNVRVAIFRKIEPNKHPKRNRM